MLYYKSTYGEKINDYFKFTIVRNPYDRILSFYFWIKGENNQTFIRDEFIDFIKANDSYQYKYINCSFKICHYENLIQDLETIKCLNKLVDFDNFPVINKSKNAEIDYNDFYDKGLKDLVYNKWKWDFILFGYKY